MLPPPACLPACLPAYLPACLPACLPQLLRGAGVKADTDTTNERTPGQKFRYWWGGLGWAGRGPGRRRAATEAEEGPAPVLRHCLGPAHAVRAACAWESAAAPYPKPKPSCCRRPAGCIGGAERSFRGLGLSGTPAGWLLARPAPPRRGCREERGVRLRVELGPKEAAAGRCVLARCRAPGEVAEKQVMAVSDL